MDKLSTLSDRILKRLERHKADLAGKQQQLDSRMKELLEQRERLDSVSKGIMDKVILPRMEELAGHFSNAEVEILHTDAGYTCVCKFAHTPRFPATVRLGIALLPGNTEHLTARYDLSLLPVLMEFGRNAEEVFSLDSEDSLSGWVEDRILDFIDDYLRLETHPLYQKDNTVIDIVCGMQISSISAASVVERQGKIFYFCSEHCKDVFVKNIK
jgi:YHS domain-containing protein